MNGIFLAPPWPLGPLGARDMLCVFGATQQCPADSFRYRLGSGKKVKVHTAKMKWTRSERQEFLRTTKEEGA